MGVGERQRMRGEVAGSELELTGVLESPWITRLLCSAERLLVSKHLIRCPIVSGR